MPDLKPVTLTTERLRLRWMDERDVVAHFAVFSDPEVTRYWSGAPWTDIAQSAEAIAATMAAYADGSGLRFGVELLESGELIGNVSLHHFVEQNRRCDIGYALASLHWGKGYVTEALEALIRYGFEVLDLNRIEADIDPLNAASARVLEKLGFRKEGYMPERWIVNGETADTAFYGLLRRYWEQARARVC
jgi:RimJ/RimL family protein N-acetyltransferase